MPSKPAPQHPGNRVIRVTLWVEYDATRWDDEADVDNPDSVRELDAAMRERIAMHLMEQDMDDDGVPVVYARVVTA